MLPTMSVSGGWNMGCGVPDDCRSKIYSETIASLEQAKRLLLSGACL
jgi:hypothetical protein